MYKHLIVCNIFFISIIHGEMIPPIKTATKTTVPVVSPKPEVKNENHTHNVLSVPLTHNVSAVTLPSNDMALINLEKTINITKETSVVARKGVNYEETKSHEDTSDIPFINKANNVTSKPLSIHNSTTVLNSTNLPKDMQKIIPHKPLLLSAEALAKMDKMNNVNINENGHSVKAHVVKAGSHPGMILPIVITILVVPMFAVVAYMALKRGQEAWKNRHYKRMDFLLDGMYND
ncbi:uncharacterized protein LOC112054499 [Bicyclus anynana]|uniref:Uncharacterized protein LOC112054499 n=1 Tax=Bicyclus anynana TaxID=110368 RepID=A0A6J1NXS2_BICAN|nr:uncharacterized protein LOC112054499 [Bicyclus anynana]